jgi:hypothetical protein
MLHRVEVDNFLCFFLLMKYSIMKEYLYICVNKFEYGRKFHGIEEI